ncbi:1-aminocyclopropane-1-carboxylate synthase [Hibiscus syriacus]|uniref:1-aminocyclopropane-1-carboxylate synthase n=1 Tax=Hibiscus syriacus TaxID=106335 RepID=A0A6A3AHS5_HIBSY|nr:1-aminocyclopropane-1-carboxylate synthase-like [Hibiscus syriacus]KAE8703666.1 1-aminocyclopropane-1-carboxylate synthase [Hibiscus syriacus]
MEFKRKNLLSKIATNDGHGENSPYFDGWKAYDSNPFHPARNPHGVIQMGLAENKLCSDLMKKWILENPHASICTAQGVDKFNDIAIFQDYHCLKEFREAVAKFMGRVGGNKVTFDANRIVMSGGATGANETVMFCLADPGDAFLVPSPYYAGFARDLRWRTRIEIIPVDCKSSNHFRITREALEYAYEKAQTWNINVKGVIVANPSNPLGTVLDRDTMRNIVSFVNEKTIHLVCDEIYAATVFSSPRFISIAEIIQDMDDCNPDLIHIVYSLSKDMGIPGFRVGIVYSFNDEVMHCARKMSSFGLVSSQTQYLLTSMLSDDQFVGNFLRESSKRLAKRHHVFIKGLEQVGISCLKSNAGLFFWMDMRPLLKEQSLQGELELWHVIIDEVKLNVSPGSSFRCSEPGWFRVCFANMDDETVEVALNRIQAFVLGQEIQEPDKSKHWRKKHLRLSFSSSRLYDETIMSPHIISPHSPLVRATT